MLIKTSNALWDNFGNYLLTPYKDNQYLLPKLEAWWEKQRARDDLELRFGRVNNKNSGLSFETYEINRQILFSHHGAVLFVPYPTSPLDGDKEVPRDKLVGVLLHDFGGTQEFYDECRQSEAFCNTIGLQLFETPVDSLGRGTEFDYFNAVRQKITELAHDASLPGGRANVLSKMLVRNTGHTGYAEKLHSDILMGIGTTLPASWARVFLHSASSGNSSEGDATYYRFEKTKSGIYLQSGMTSGHIGARDCGSDHPDYGKDSIVNRGPWHRAPTMSRTVFLNDVDTGGREPFRPDDSSPWGFTPLALAS